MQTSTAWKPWLFAVLAGMLGLAGEHLVERFQRERMIDHERQHVANQLAGLRTSLEGVISGHLLMVHGLSAVIAAQPDIDQAGFARIASSMIGNAHAMRNIAGAPDLVIRLMYPVTGNEAAIGLDYRTHHTQRDAALQAAETGEIVIAGPLELVQGGLGLVAREPVFLLPEKPGASRRLWGLVSAVMEVDKLFELASLAELVQKFGLSVTIRGRDSRGAEGDTFFGDAALFDNSPVLASVSLPVGSWQLAAAPQDGWQSHLHAEEIILTRGLGILLSALIAILAYAVTRKTQVLQQTAAELQESQTLFNNFMDNLPAGAFVKDSQADRVLFENRWLRTHLPVANHGCGVDDDEDLATLRSGTQRLHYEITTTAGRQMFCDTLRFLLANGGDRELVGGVVMDVSDRVRAEHGLAYSEERLRLALEAANQGLYDLDLDSGDAVVSPEYARMLGYEPDKFHENNAAWLERLHPDDRESVKQVFGDYIAGRIPEYRVEFRQRTRYGDWQWILSHGKIQERDADGRPLRMLGTHTDIAAFKAVQQDLAASEAQLKEAQRLARIGNWEIHHADGRLHWSDEVYRIFGLDPDAFDPMYPAFLERIHGSDSAMVDSVFKQSVARHEPFLVRHSLQRADGSLRHVEERGETTYDDAGQPLCTLGTVQDITETREAEIALAESERRQRLFIEHAPAALAMFDRDMRYLAVSRRWLRDYGLARQQVLGESHYNVFPEIPEHWKAIHRRALAGEVISADDDRFEGLDGSVQWLRWEVRPWHTVENAVGGIVIFSEDISARKRAEQDLQQLNEELEKRVAQRTRQLQDANNELETFTYSVSHDLKAPLRGIDGYSRLLLEDYAGKLDEEGALFLNNVRRGVEQMTQLIDDLLAYSRIERRSVHKVKVDIAELIDMVVAERTDDLLHSGVKVEITAEPLTVEADADGLKLALRNLLDNAVKFSADEPAPNIRITVRATEQDVELAVIDNGIGFDMRFCDRIFDIFQRLQRSEDFPGTGIGLAIARKAMQRMRGQLHATSEPGKGATFILEIPR